MEKYGPNGTDRFDHINYGIVIADYPSVIAACVGLAFYVLGLRQLNWPERYSNLVAIGGGLIAIAGFIKATHKLIYVATEGNEEGPTDYGWMFDQMFQVMGVGFTMWLIVSCVLVWHARRIRTDPATEVPMNNAIIAVPLGIEFIALLITWIACDAQCMLDSGNLSWIAIMAGTTVLFECAMAYYCILRKWKYVAASFVVTLIEAAAVTPAGRKLPELGKQALTFFQSVLIAFSLYLWWKKIKETNETEGTLALKLESGTDEIEKDTKDEEN